MNMWQKRGACAALAFILSLSLVQAAQAGTERKIIGAEKAVSSAVAKSGGGNAVLVQYTEETDRPLYRVLITDGVNRFDVDVDAISGEAVKFARREISSVKLSPKGMTGWEARLDPQTVEPTALAATGGGVVVRTDRKTGGDGSCLYDFEIVKDNVVYSVDIDADSGALVLYEEKVVGPLLSTASAAK